MTCSTGIGGPSTSIAVEELAQLGVRTFLRIGTTGAIQPHINEGDILVSQASVRLDGASQHFAPLSYPLTKAYLKAKREQGKRTAIIHFDAHTDLLVERLGIDLCFGSWCTHILEFLPAPHHLIQFGIRSSGKPKSHWVC